MLSISAFTFIAVLASAFVGRADVTPSEPSPGKSFNEGAACPIVWLGDVVSPTAWKNMSIELMSGDNENMVHITTVASGQDGTTGGTFSYTCPAVTPNSAIYFYQFTAPGAQNKTWTTRFTIASASGATTPPAQDTQPDGQSTPWGVGALADPSTAVPPPPWVGLSGAITSVSSTSGLLSSSSTSVPPTSASGSLAITAPGTSSKLIQTAVVSAPSSAPSTAGAGTGSNGAITLSATSALTSLIIPALAIFLS